MDKETVKKIIIVASILFISGIVFLYIFFGYARRPEKPYEESEAEIIFMKDFEKKTDATFLFSSSAKEVEKWKELRLSILGDADSLSYTARLDNTNIRRFSDSLFTEFIKIYPRSRKATIDSIKINYDLINVDTTFAYKVR